MKLGFFSCCRDLRGNQCQTKQHLRECRISYIGITHILCVWEVEFNLGSGHSEPLQSKEVEPTIFGAPIRAAETYKNFRSSPTSNMPSGAPYRWLPNDYVLSANYISVFKKKNKPPKHKDDVDFTPSFPSKMPVENLRLFTESQLWIHTLAGSTQVHGR